MTRKELKEYNDLVSEYNEIYKENKELKKQLEEINYICIPNSDIKNVIDKYKNQQKEFIELKDTIKAQKKVIGVLSNRIIKAIEYIENDLQSFLYSVEYKTLLDLLKGENNER